MSEHTFSIITVTLEDRDDDGLRAYSDDLPGLVLWGADRRVVADAIVPAIKALFEHRGIRNVAVHAARPLEDVLQKRSPRQMDVHVRGTAPQRTQFVVELTPG
jgi:hypothetical protein